MVEQERLEALQNLAVFENDFSHVERLTQLAASTLGNPVDADTLVDDARVWLKSRVDTDVTYTDRASIRCMCSIAGGPDVPCEIVDMRLDEVTIKIPVVPRIGDKTTLSMPLVGLLEGELLRRSDDGYVVRLAAQRPLQLARLAGFLEAAEAPSRKEQRRHERIVPLNRLVHVDAANDRRYMARIIDLSRSGVAVTCMASMEAGTDVKIGSTRGTVVRVLEGGYAMAFDQPLSEPFDFNTRL